MDKLISLYITVLLCSIFHFDAEKNLSDDINTSDVRKKTLRKKLKPENIKLSGLSLSIFKVILLIVI